MILISLWLWTSVFVPAVWLQKPLVAKTMRGASGEAGPRSPAPGHFLLPPEGLFSSFPHPSEDFEVAHPRGCFLELQPSGPLVYLHPGPSSHGENLVSQVFQSGLGENLEELAVEWQDRG